jgi:hypothetical protein
MPDSVLRAYDDDGHKETNTLRSMRFQERPEHLGAGQELFRVYYLVPCEGEVFLQATHVVHLYQMNVDESETHKRHTVRKRCWVVD